MSPVVGYATLQVIPSLKGVHEAIRQALGSGAAGGVADQAGKSIGARMGAGMSQAVSAAGRVAMQGLEAAALAGGAAASAALVKGWGRMTAIEDATAGLTVLLGDSAAASDLLGDTLETIQGTPFRLDQFATAAQQLVGMGIEADKVPGYLEAIGSAASTQGGRANEMVGRLSMVFGQVQALGRLTGEDLRQISETGVGALAILANEWGVTTGEMQTMISEGAVPAGEALDALAAGIMEGSDGPAGATRAFGGLMEELGSTTTGAMAIASAAVDRLGQGVLEQFRPAIIDGLGAFTDTADRLAEVLGDLAGRAAASGVVESLVDALEGGPDLIDRVVSGLEDLDGVAAVLLGSLGGLATKGIGGLLGTIGIAIPGIGPFVGALAGIVLSSDEARGALGDLAGELMPILGNMLGSLEPFLDAVRDAAGDLIPALADVLVAAADAAGDLLAVAAPLAADLLGLATPVLVASLEGIAWALERMGGVIPYVAAGWAAIKAAQIAPAVWGRVADAFDKIAIKSYDMAGNLKSAAANAAMFGAVALGAVALTALWQGFDRARRAAEQWRSEVEADIDTSNMDSYRDAIAKADEQVAVSSRSFGDAISSPWAAVQLGIKGTVEVLTPLENSVVDAFYAMEGGEEAAAALRAQLRLLESQLDEVGGSLGISRDQVQRWVDVLDLDVAELGVEGVTEAIGDAVRMADTGSPAVESLADALTTLGDEATTTTDQLDALEDALDAMIGTQVGWEDATLSWQEGINALLSGPEAAAEAETAWSTSLTGLDEASLTTRGIVSGLVDQALDMAVAFGEAGGGVEGATWKLAEGRDQIIAAGEAAGISRDKMEEYLETLGLTPENLETLIEAHTNPGEVDAINTAIDHAARPRSIQMTLNTIALMQSLEAFDQQLAGRGTMVVTGRRWGGIDHYAAGGVRDAMLGSGRNMVWWDEPATGGEAYIPRLGDKARSKQILDVAAGWYGLDVVPQQSAPATAGGGTAGAQAPLVVHTQASDPEGVAAALWREMARR